MAEWAQGQVAVSVQSHTGRVLDCSGVQLAGMLDDLFFTTEPLGDTTCPDTKQHRISVWVSVEVAARRKAQQRASSGALPCDTAPHVCGGLCCWRVS